MKELTEAQIELYAREVETSLVTNVDPYDIYFGDVYLSSPASRSVVVIKTDEDEIITMLVKPHIILFIRSLEYETLLHINGNYYSLLYTNVLPHKQYLKSLETLVVPTGKFPDLPRIV